MATQVAVCGPAECTDTEAAAARRVGELLAHRGAVVLCGGGPGVMAAAAAGARGGGGLAIGILPGADRSSANRSDVAPGLSAEVATNMGQARNAILVTSADAVIAVGGSWGTLSEVALAMRLGRRVVSLGGWRILDANGDPVPGIHYTTTPEQAVAAALTPTPPPPEPR
jgi:uncharacterized protein (TIGR00725 family)